MEPDTARLLDANLNRAREALRVVEDYARFALDDAAAATRIKQSRHDLRRVAESLGADRLLGARHVAGDVGRDVKTESESRRDTATDVVRAAFARFGEATRALGEYGKLVDPTAAQLAESLRYRAYDLEQRLLLRGPLCKRLRAARLYVIITEEHCRGDWLATAAAAIAGGAACIQLREKHLSDAELLERAEQVREIAQANEVLFVINDRPDIARLARADGVHIGQDDLSVAQARRIGGGNLLVGKSTHNLAQFEAALSEEPDYIAVGPVFPSPTKPRKSVAGPDTLAAAAKCTQVPLIGIGGITAENAARVLKAGASGVCVCSAVSAASDAEAAARKLLRSCPP
jgi:thiamine-phosphate pyrophosphorylase